MAAGHSLGEYSALVAAGALTFEDGLKLVRLRGELMQQAGGEVAGTMAAIVGLDSKIVNDICAKLRQNGIVQAANFNSPGRLSFLVRWLVCIKRWSLQRHTAQNCERTAG